MIPGSQCYYYVPGLTTNSDPSSVLMFEDPNNHGPEGGNVLYQDGHVQFEKGPKFTKIVNDNMPNAQ